MLQKHAMRRCVAQHKPARATGFRPAYLLGADDRIRRLLKWMARLRWSKRRRMARCWISHGSGRDSRAQPVPAPTKSRSRSGTNSMPGWKPDLGIRSAEGTAPFFAVVARGTGPDLVVALRFDPGPGSSLKTAWRQFRIYPRQPTDARSYMVLIAAKN